MKADFHIYKNGALQNSMFEVESSVNFDSCGVFQFVFKTTPIETLIICKHGISPVYHELEAK